MSLSSESLRESLERAHNVVKKCTEEEKKKREILNGEHPLLPWERKFYTLQLELLTYQTNHAVRMVELFSTTIPLDGTRINETTFVTSDGYRLVWLDECWTDNDMVFHGTLESGPLDGV